MKGTTKQGGGYHQLLLELIPFSISECFLPLACWLPHLLGLSPTLCCVCCSQPLWMAVPHLPDCLALKCPTTQSSEHFSYLHTLPQ